MKKTLPIAEHVKRFLAKHGVTPTPQIEAAATELLTGFFRRGERIRTLEAEGGSAAPDARVTALQHELEQAEDEVTRLTGLVPAAGAVVLVGEDATVYAAFQALNLKPADITTAIKQRDDLAATNAKHERGKLNIDAARALGYTNVDVLTDILEQRGLVVEMRDATVMENGKAVTKKVPHVRKASDEKAVPELLHAVVERDLKGYLPALTAKDAASPTATGQITPFPHLVKDAPAAPAGDAADEFLKKRNTAASARSNPLIPQRPAAAAAS